jgi:hypothetical protein
MVLAAENDGNKLTVYVDPTFSSNWRKEPYYSQLRDLAHRLAGQVQLIVRIKNRAIALLPSKEIDLGRFENNDHIVFSQNRMTGDWNARVIKAKDVPADLRDRWYSTF